MELKTTRLGNWPRAFFQKAMNWKNLPRFLALTQIGGGQAEGVILPVLGQKN